MQQVLELLDMEEVQPHLRNCLHLSVMLSWPLAAWFRVGFGRLATWCCSAAATFASQGGGEASECDSQRGVAVGFLGPVSLWQRSFLGGSSGVM